MLSGKTSHEVGEPMLGSGVGNDIVPDMFGRCLNVSPCFTWASFQLGGIRVGPRGEIDAASASELKMTYGHRRVFRNHVKVVQQS